jgi:hypothetical protein
MRRLAIALTAGVLGIPGCHARSVSSSQFLVRGNGVCAIAARRIDNLAIPRTRPGEAAEQFAGYVDDYVAEMRLELTNLRAIGYPPGERTQLDDDYRELQIRLDAAERDPQAFRPQALEPPELALRQAGLSACKP